MPLPPPAAGRLAPETKPLAHSYQRLPGHARNGCCRCERKTSIGVSGALWRSGHWRGDRPGLPLSRPSSQLSTTSFTQPERPPGTEVRSDPTKIQSRLHGHLGSLAGWCGAAAATPAWPGGSPAPRKCRAGRACPCAYASKGCPRPRSRSPNRRRWRTIPTQSSRSPLLAPVRFGANALPE